WHDPVIGDVAPGKPADRAGMRKGDRVVRMRSDTVRAWEEFVLVLRNHPSDSIPLTVSRAGATISFTVVPEVSKVKNDSGVEREVGIIGVSIYVPLKRYGLPGSLRMGLVRTGESADLVLFMLKGLLTGQLSPRDLGGPILVGQISGEAIRMGIDIWI